MRRTLALIAALTLLISLLAACGGQPTPTGGAQAPATSGGAKVKVRLATWAGVDESKELQAVVDKINAKATTFEIVQEAQPADYYTKLQTNLAGGTAADLIWLSQEYIAGYAQKGVLLDISDRYGMADAAIGVARLDLPE